MISSQAGRPRFWRKIGSLLPQLGKIVTNLAGNTRGSAFSRVARWAEFRPILGKWPNLSMVGRGKFWWAEWAEYGLISSCWPKSDFLCSTCIENPAYTRNNGCFQAIFFIWCQNFGRFLHNIGHFFGFFPKNSDLYCTKLIFYKMAEYGRISSRCGPNLVSKTWQPCSSILDDEQQQQQHHESGGSRYRIAVTANRPRQGTNLLKTIRVLFPP